MRPVLIVALLLASSASLAQLPADLPKRKPGLWEMKTSVAEMGGAGPILQQCIDEHTDNLLAQRAESGDCSQLSVRREGHRLAVDAVCQVEGSRASIRGQFTGDFERSYRGEMSSTYDPPLHGMRAATMTQEGRWLGPCRPGQKPGDVTMQGMQSPGNINLEQLMRNLPQLPAR